MTEYEKAITLVREVMQKDEDLALTYQCTVTMAIYDNSKLSITEANTTADAVMERLFCK